MKNQMFFVIAVICILIIGNMATLRFVKADSKMKIVPTDFPTISAAVANASNGDTIFVKSGIYNEPSLLIDKKLALMGENKNNTIIILHSVSFSKTFDFYGTPITFTLWENVINITASNAKLSGLTIKCYNSQGGEISLTGDNVQIMDNNIEWSISGSGNNIQIFNNNFAGAIMLTGSNLTVAQNKVGDFIDCHQGSYNIITENAIGTVVKGEDYPVNPRLCLNTGSFSIVIGNNITYSAIGGLGLMGNGSVAADNNITGSIWVDGSDNTVCANTALYGGLIVSGNNNSFYANNIGGYNQTQPQYDYTLKKTNFYFYQSAPYTLSLGSNDGVLTGKKSLCINNTFYYNNFYGNTQVRVWDGVSGPNYWSYANHGNYWSDYNGSDINGDCIGDLPYNMDVHNSAYQSFPMAGMQDAYPLMAPFNGTVNVPLPSWAPQSVAALVSPPADQASIGASQSVLYIGSWVGAVAIAVCTGLFLRFKKQRSKDMRQL
jgi:hypothetical protein